MNVLMVRAKIKEENVADARAATDEGFARGKSPGRAARHGPGAMAATRPGREGRQPGCLIRVA
jgi:hypothetical protein